MPKRIEKILNRLQLVHLTKGLSDENARALRVNATFQAIMFLIPTLLLPVIYFTEPPETHLASFISYLIFVLPLGYSRYLLYKGSYAMSAVFALSASNFHITSLSILQADDPAPLGFLLFAVIPFLMIPRKNIQLRWFFVSLSGFLFLGSQYYYRVMGKEGLFGPPKWVVPADYLMPPLVLLVFFFILLINQFVKAVNKAEDKLIAEHQKSESLLLNVLPLEVARELKQNGVSKPRHYSSATVCFTDFEGFTKIAETLSPSELVEELDRCFSYFDSLMERHKLEKLKTIGDSYMFVGGIPKSNATHAIDSVLAALEIQAFMNQMKEIKAVQGLPYWELRLGIHSGELIAGVIGDKKFAYDVWSDTVNTASRCESSGMTGKINISSSTYELIKDFFQCEYRGEVPAKHKGNIKMYFVEGLLPELQREGHPKIPNQEFAKRYSALTAIS
ncbi:adenylate/guanylate cyclase domain-containing protein [Leptospira meyeri]|uniref:adenylate/guanylate cyclase domain-containing protein n=1 Tax=Leptospira meyeri TaxID=29508 RepID=UPI0002BE24CB|nr:adenylate/guanylate cyclase domain-containing protein [Leptospira meyeri]EMJ89111.1 adenylate/guanylate cyclase catalytic domain protein [Leptospira meyeri serovar Semaranga str. Veldrot Semarang 173]